MSYFGSRDPLFEIAKGNVPGHELVTIVATNPALTASTDVWDIAVPLVYPTGVESIELLTTGVDTIAGTGAQKITTEYLDSDFNTQETTTDTNAGTAAISTTNFYRHQKSYVSQAGSGGGNAGTIIIQTAGGGVGSARGQINTPAAAALPANTTRASHYTVPLGKTAISVAFYADSKKGDDADVEVYATDGANGIFRPIFPVSVYQMNNSLILRGSQQLPEKTDIKAVATTAAGPVKISFVLQIVVMDNSEVNNA